MPSVRRALLSAITPLLISLGAGVACYFALGATTGFFFGATVVVALLTPPLVLAHDERFLQLLTAAAVVDGVAVACLFAVAEPAVSLPDWLKVYALLTAFGAALCGVARVLRSARFPPVLASALTVVLALAWLTWPVWGSPWLAGRDGLAGWLVAPHPLFAIDSALRHLGPPWTERHYMYTRLTVLNQDVFYSLPGGVGGAVFFHSALAALSLLPYRWLLRRRRLVQHDLAAEDDGRQHSG